MYGHNFTAGLALGTNFIPSDLIKIDSILLPATVTVNFDYVVFIHGYLFSLLSRLLSLRLDGLENSSRFP